MKAIRVKQFGRPEVCVLDENVPLPVPSADQILIAVHYAGVNPVDTYVRTGTFAVLPTLPYTPGYDSGGVVEAVGVNVSDFKVGDRVYTRGSATGTYAEYVLAEPANVFLLHSSLTFAQGACIGIPYYTAYRSLFHKASAKAGMKVLIHGGSGGVGVAAIQVARAYGLEVLGTAGTERGLQLVRDQGAHAAFCHREKGYQQKIADYTCGKGVDIIIEMAANVNLRGDLALLAPRGKVIVVGSRGTETMDPGLLMGPETAIVGVSLASANKADWLEMRAAVWAGCERGWLRPVVDKEYSLGDAWVAHRDIIHSKGAHGNLVLKIA